MVRRGEGGERLRDCKDDEIADLSVGTDTFAS